MYKYPLITLVAVVLLAAGCTKAQETVNSNENKSPEVPAEQPAQAQTTDFSKLSPTYKFSAVISKGLVAEYVSVNDSINIFDPNLPGNSSLEKSVIFIRNFSANDFLTLSTVDILNRNATSAQGHAAVQYEIKKKDSVPNFPNQPLWRSEQHKLIDIRYAKSNPSPFFVFSYNPSYSEAEFNSFIASLKFHNDN